ncbi:MAG: metallophosphoesterase family protein, partial [Verrucomicrobia bacterium]|nr:metallophosphoesterase family protein [Verrucomicrobiota bacterium]
MNTQLVLRTVMWLAAFLLCAPALQADWSFVMMGDTKGEGGHTTTGVSEELPIIAQKIASLTLKPDLVLVAGDLCCGDELGAGSPLWNYSIQFLNWKLAMQPVFDYATNTGIPIYPVRGNHDNAQSQDAPIPDLKEAY